MECKMETRFFLQLVLLIASCLSVNSHAETSGVRMFNEFKSDMIEHFEYFEDVRHPREDSKKSWEEAREYIQGFFRLKSFEPELQCFNTTVSIEFDNEKTVRGCNIIATSPGPINKRNLIVIGADYDSSGSKAYSVPLRNNGAGISLLLEVARAYQDSWKWKGWERNFTTIFVAFDLNTKEQFPASNGHPGSYHFVNNWLLPKLQGSKTALGNSIILDSVSTYNREPNSQTLSADFVNVFPEAYERIRNGSKVGDYIAAVSPQMPESAEFVKDFSAHYRMDRRRRPYRLQEMVAESTELGTGSTYKTLNYQASYHFWTAKPKLPSVLITDTGDERKLPTSEDCTSETECDYEFANNDRMQFLYHTYKALSFTLIEKQQTYVGSTQSSGVVMSSQSLISVLAISAFLLIANNLNRL